jgi:carboxypeptidase Q
MSAKRENAKSDHCNYVATKCCGRDARGPSEELEWECNSESAKLASVFNDSKLSPCNHDLPNPVMEGTLHLRLLQSFALISTLILMSAFVLPDPLRSAAKQQRLQTGTAQQSPSPSPTPMPVPLPPPTVKINDYRTPAGRIIGAALTSDRAYTRLAYLTDRIGNRLSGSKNLARAIQWALAEMKSDGLDNIRAEKVMVPHWVRGEESLEMISPEPRKLSLVGLGNSVSTPPEGIVAEAIVVRSFDELEALGERVRGKIVVYNAPFVSYGETVKYRGTGASRAARYGAVAALVRSITPVSLQTPHTGAMTYNEKQPKIPTAAITIEGAELLQRMNDRGERPTLRLKMEAKFLPDAESANVVAELKGSEKPDEVVLLGGHFDSWDVGQGAQDDGGGVIIAWETVRLLKELGLRPRRTIRVVLYTNEENGARGGDAYRDAHRAEIAKHILVIESDSGCYRPEGFGLATTAPPQARANFIEIAKLLTGIRADRIAANGGGTDINPMMKEGVVGASLNVDGTKYFEIHHTAADTLDKVNPQELALCVAAMAVMAYTVADMPQELSGSTPNR